jgi:hypothetical protein
MNCQYEVSLLLVDSFPSDMSHVDFFPLINIQHTATSVVFWPKENLHFTSDMTHLMWYRQVFFERPINTERCKICYVPTEQHRNWEWCIIVGRWWVGSYYATYVKLPEQGFLMQSWLDCMWQCAVKRVKLLHVCMAPTVSCVCLWKKICLCNKPG